MNQTPINAKSISHPAVEVPLAYFSLASRVASEAAPSSFADVAPSRPLFYSML